MIYKSKNHSIPFLSLGMLYSKTLKRSEVVICSYLSHGLTSISFSNCTEELSFASFFCTQFENSNDIIHTFFCKKLKSSLSTESFLIFVQCYENSLVFCSSIVVG